MSCALLGGLVLAALFYIHRISSLTTIEPVGNGGAPGSVELPEGVAAFLEKVEQGLEGIAVAGCLGLEAGCDLGREALDGRACIACGETAGGAGSGQDMATVQDDHFLLLPAVIVQSRSRPSMPAFLRAYAAHVGLDPEKVLTAYHLSGPVPIKRPVTLPADFPIAEKRAPVGGARGDERAHAALRHDGGRARAGHGRGRCRRMLVPVRPDRQEQL